MNLRKIKGLLYLLTHLSPRVCLNLGKFELCVVGVHFTDLLSGWGSKNLERIKQMRRNIMSFYNCYSLVKNK